MAKIGRNDACPCGSGLKYKRCHGSVVEPKTAPGNLALGATQAGLQIAGFPGQHQQFHQIFRFKEGDPRNDLPIEGAPGDYKVVFVLKRPGYPLHPERQISFFERSPR
jgi:SEC-C motif